MPDPTASDDDWNDLARELDIDKSTPPPLPAPDDRVELGEPPPIDPEFDDPEVMETPEPGEPEGGEEFDDAEESVGEVAETGEAVAEGEAQPGTGRKRRRRRRRRRKGGQPGEVVASAATTDADEVSDVATEVEELTEAEPAAESDDFDAMEDLDIERGSLADADEEDTASEVLRDLIANWNVPSWDDIVSGLYRPG